jgi:hypothetical protein
MQRNLNQSKLTHKLAQSATFGFPPSLSSRVTDAPALLHISKLDEFGKKL